MQNKKSSSAAVRVERNPLYLKIGKRIRQARLMAKETNSRELSLRLGWSAGRMHNYESGVSTPGVEETLQFCEALSIDPGWLTYGIGAPRAAQLNSSRYRKFIDALEQAEREGWLTEILDAIKISHERLQQFRNNPQLKIPNLVARRCEKYLGKRRGWFDEPQAAVQSTVILDEDLQDLLDLHARLDADDRKRLNSIGRVLLEQANSGY